MHTNRVVGENRTELCKACAKKPVESRKFLFNHLNIFTFRADIQKTVNPLALKLAYQFPGFFLTIDRAGQQAMGYAPGSGVRF